MFGLGRLFLYTTMSSSPSDMSSPDFDRSSPVAFLPVPSEEGRKLMASGVFGVSNPLRHTASESPRGYSTESWVWG